MTRDQEQIRKIGRVTLDFSLYPGEDFYCDGEVEQELLALSEQYTPDQFERLIRERKDWPTLYHFSTMRGNIVDWVPMNGTEKVLEIGAGPGAITSALSPKAGSVTCVELSKVRSLINANRNRERDNITIRVGNFEDIEPNLDTDYDFIFLIGVFEYSALYIHTNDPFREELIRIKKHLKKGGRLIIAIENRLGMKYFAGCREDHSGRYFDGIEGYENSPDRIRTFSRQGLEKFLKDCGLFEYQFYYPYPDYKFMTTLYSDLRLPLRGELTENIRNFDRDRLLLFDEKKAFDAVLSEELFPVFSNSYLICAGPQLPVCYAKFSRERAASYRIATEQIRENGTEYFRKRPLTGEAAAHLQKLSAACGKLSARYEGSGLSIAPCRWDDTRQELYFDFVSGVSLESILDGKLREKDVQGFIDLVRMYRQKISYGEDAGFSDPDMIFSNILVDNDTWTAIDYEWASSETVSGERMLLRAMECFFREDEKRRQYLEEVMTKAQLYGALGLDEQQGLLEEAREDALQEKVTGGITALGELRFDIGGDVIVPAELAVEQARSEAGKKHAVNLATTQIYTDTGKGFSEAESYFLDQNYGEEGRITFTVPVPENVRNLRIDPALCPCVCLIRGIRIGTSGNDLRDETLLFEKRVKTNGKDCGGGTYLFSSHDPWFVTDTAKLKRKAGVSGNALLEITLQMSGLPGTMAEAMKLHA